MSIPEDVTKEASTLNYGDLVVHPTKPWPWLGMVQYRSGGISYCGACGLPKPGVGLRKPMIPGKPSSKSESQDGWEPTANGVDCTEDYCASPSYSGVFSPAEDPRLDEGEEDSFLANNADICGCQQADETEPMDTDVVEENPVVLPGAETSSKWQIMWYPMMDSCPADGKETVVFPCGSEKYFQEGHAVLRPGTGRRGIIKKIKQKMDGFILPEFEKVAINVPCDFTDGAQLLDQQPGHYVIKNGWIGSVYGMWNKVRFQMEDGTEFWLRDETQEFSLYFSEVLAHTRNLPIDSYQMYPGMSVRAPYLVLKGVEWVPAGHKISNDIQAKITLSEELWTSGNYDACWWLTADDNEAKQFYEQRLFQISSSGSLPTVDKLPISSQKSGTGSHPESEKCDEAMEKAMRNWNCKLHKANRISSTWSVSSGVNLPNKDGAPVKDSETSEVDDKPKKGSVEETIEDSTGPETTFDGENKPKKRIKQEALRLRIMEVLPTKLDVEWRNQVKGADSKSPPARNIVTDDEFNKIEWFKVPSSFALTKGLSTRIRCKLGNEIEVVSSEQYRTHCAKDEKLNTSQESTHGTSTSRSDVYLYVIAGKCALDILWEDGEMEKGVPAKDVKPAPFLIEGRDYFPGMYVLSLKRTLDEKKIEDKNRFGLVINSSNQEKFALIKWYRWNSSKTSSQPIVEQTEEVSFYDIKSHPEFNYVNGSLISWLNRDATQEDEPNVGYVVQKLPEGKVLVRWFNSKEESVNPWELCKLKAEGAEYEESGSGGSYGSDDEQGMEHCYSPTEHEYDDLEDLRYYEYMSLTETERWERVALLVEVVEPMLALMARMVTCIHRNFPLMERRQFVKMTLHCDDIISGFAHLGRFKTVISRFYTEKLKLDPSKSVPDTKNGSHSTCTNELLIWNIATWLYDWLEVTHELQAAINKHRPDLPGKKPKQDSAAMSVGSTSESDMSASSSWSQELSVEEKKANKRMLQNLSEWQTSVQTAFTAVSQVLGHGQTPISTAPLVLECTSALNKALASDVIGDSQKSSKPSEEDELQSAHRFLKLFVTQAKTVEKLPCFAYNLPPDGDIKTLSKAWKTYGIGDYDQPTAAIVSSRSHSPIGRRKEPSPPSDTIIQRMIKELEDIGTEPLCFGPDEIIPFINDVADALSMSIVLILAGIVKSIKAEISSEMAKLREEIEKLPPSGSNDSSDPDEESQMETESAELETTILSPASFTLLPIAPTTHRFISKPFDAALTSKTFLSAVRRELRLLQSALPPGIFVKAYEDRMDLFSCMILGPTDTPYEGGLFFFDVRLKEDFPARPPHVFYKSMSKRLNPNLYEDGMVCLSLLGTWDGKENELWTANSTLLQVFLSIQSLVLVSEPYFNEPGYEKEKGSETGTKKSRDYNESAILLTLESIQRVCLKPPEPFDSEVRAHFKETLPKLQKLLEKYQSDSGDFKFPLLPVTQGFRLCIKRHAKSMSSLIEKQKETT